MNFQNPLNVGEFKKESELWKENWKALYKPWIIFFVVLASILSAVTIGYIVVSFLNVESILNNYRESLNGMTPPITNIDQRVNDLRTSYLLYFQLIPILFLLLMIGLLGFFIYSLITSNKKQSLRFLNTTIFTIMALFGMLIIIGSIFLPAGMAIENPIVLFRLFLGIFSIIFYFYPSSKIKRFKANFQRSYFLQKQKDQLEEFKKNGNFTSNAQGFSPMDIFNGMFSNAQTNTSRNTSNTNQANDYNSNEESKTSQNKNREKLEDLSTEQLHLLAEKLFISGHEEMNRNELLNKILNYLEIDEEAKMKTDAKITKEKIDDDFNKTKKHE
ncbi:hypothetical protein [[Mycoplasma] mobile]|uniref:Expressed protein n=1 Tax=Mycoplasma mobile (strain ATCC 43663 / 163K / NCTC 11711) TaxID=267748 RepID=Q6KHV2_MYCM1|nr:hypothetical protein [[Mycoplasma] mobile]AAT27825.1 expressed protein [Mycoplasma mobile 163K]